MPTELESSVYKRLALDAFCRPGHEEIDVILGRPLDRAAPEMLSLGPAVPFSATISTFGDDAETFDEMLEDDANDLVGWIARQILDDAPDERVLMAGWRPQSLAGELSACSEVILSWNAWRSRSFPAGIPAHLIRGGSLAVPWGQLVLLMGGHGQYHIEAQVSDMQQGSRHKIDITTSAWRFRERRRRKELRPRIVRVTVLEPESFLIPQGPSPLQQMLG